MNPTMEHTMRYEITEDEGNHELTINGMEVWVGTLAECQEILAELAELDNN